MTCASLQEFAKNFRSICGTVSWRKRFHHVAIFPSLRGLQREADQRIANFLALTLKKDYSLSPESLATILLMIFCCSSGTPIKQLIWIPLSKTFFVLYIVSCDAARWEKTILSTFVPFQFLPASTLYYDIICILFVVVIDVFFQRTSAVSTFHYSLGILLFFRHP